MNNRTNSKKYIEKQFPDLKNYKVTTSRMYEKGDKPGYQDTWWFNFMFSDLEDSEYIVFAGALDYLNKDFRIIKIPSSYLISHIDKIDMNSKGWINLYIHFDELVDLRHKSNLSLKQFNLN